MVKRNNSYVSRLIAVLLAVVLLAGMIPQAIFSTFAASEAGTVESLVNGGAVDGSNVLFENVSLDWVEKNPTIGRNYDGWWIGIKAIAPASLTEQELQNAKYISGGTEKSFWTNKDSKEGDETHYIGLWGLINEGNINDAIYNNKNVEYVYEFDWDGDGVFEQPVKMELNPLAVTLKKGGADVYPLSTGKAEVKPFTDGLEIKDNKSNYVTVAIPEKATFKWHEKDTTIGRNFDGWWVGINVIAPEGYNKEKAAYQNFTSSGWGTAKNFEDNKDGENSTQLWGLINETYIESALAKNKNLNYTYRFDWDGDGIFEQLIHTAVDPKKVVLKAEDGSQVYPALATITPYTGGTVTGNTSNLKLVIEETSLNWSKADSTIGRHTDGWWVGMNVTAPEGFDADKAYYNSRVTSSVSDSGWSDSRKVMFKDVKDTDTSVQMWMCLTQALVDKYEGLGRNIATEYAFDWDGDGVIDQTLSLEVVPSNKIVLNKVSQDAFKFGTKYPEDQWVGSKYTNKASGGDGKGEVTYEITFGSDVATIDALTGELTFIKAGIVTVKATKAADDVYKEATDEYTVNAYDKSQDGDFKFANSNTDIQLEYNDKTFTNVASGGDGTGLITYTSSDESVATVDSNGVVTLKKAGSARITATKAASYGYKESEISYWVYVIKSEQEPLNTQGTPKKITYSPNAQNVISLKGGSGEGEIEYLITGGHTYAEIDSKTGAITTLNAGGSFMVEIRKAADDCYLYTSTSFVIEVEHADQTGFGFAMAAPEAITYNDNNNFFENEASGGQSTGNIAYEFTSPTTVAEIDPHTGKLRILTSGTVEVKATKYGDERYNDATATYTLEIKRDVPEFTVENANLTYGKLSYIIRTNEILGSNGEFTYAIKSGDDLGATVDGGGRIKFSDSDKKVGTFTVEVTRLEDPCYEKLSKEMTVTVSYLTGTPDPTVSGETKNSSGWYTGNAKIKAPAGYVISYDNELSTNDWDSFVAVNNEGANDKPVYLKKIADGYITDAIVLDTIYLDTAAPVSAEIKYDTPILERIIETVTFGIYKSDSVTVTLTATDTNSGVDYFTYNIGEGDVKLESKDFTKNANGVAEYTFVISAQYRDTITMSATDVAGNTCNVTEIGKVLVVDTVKPEMTVSYEYSGNNTEVDDVIHTDDSVTAVIDITDSNFDLSLVDGADKPTVTLDGNAVSAGWSRESGDKWRLTFPITEDGDHIVEVSYTDLSGNAVQSYRKEIRIDRVKPVIDVKFTDDNPVRTIKEDAYDVSYFDESKSVTITITEHNFDASKVKLDVDAIDVKGNTVDISAKAYKAFAKNPANWKHNGDVHTLVLDSSNAKLFDIDATYDFFLRCNDIIGNEADSYERDFAVDKGNPTGLTIEYSESLIDKIIETVTFGFYKADLTVTLTAKDATTGVYYFTYKYNKEDNASNDNTATYEKTIEATDITYSDNGMTAKATFTVKPEARGYIEAAAYDRSDNLIGKSDQNLIKVVDSVNPGVKVEYTADNKDAKVQITDNANKTVSSMKNAAKVYYNSSLTAKITVDEANFFDGVTAQDGVIHNIGIKLSKTDNAGTKTVTEYLPEGATQMYTTDNTEYITWITDTADKDVHYFTIALGEDADYELEIEYTDLSDNTADFSDNNDVESVASYTSKLITVDTVKPVVNVEYSNKDVVRTIDGRDYLDKIQTATVTVTEHNFRAEDFKAVYKALDVNGDAVEVENYTKKLATDGEWTHNGDVHTMEIEFTEDANYNFDYTFVDLSKNAADEYKEDLFTVDTTKPQNLKVSYSTSILDKIIESVTFGYYNAQMTVTISAEDDTSGIYYFVYSYRNAADVSKVNAELIEDIIEEASKRIEKEGNTFTTTFTIPKLLLENDNQFNGKVDFAAFDRSENTDGMQDERRVVVDNIAPTSTIEYNKPVREENNISYYDGDIKATLVINEANFYSEDVVITVTKDGKAYKPAELKWVNDSVDKHTCTFTLKDDGDYIVNVEYKDRSSNEMVSYTSNRLTRDTTLPTVNVTNIKNNSANKDDKYGFTITVNDINLDESTFKPSLSAVVRNEDGSYSVKAVSLGNVKIVTEGKTASYTVDNLTEDAIYTLTCAVSDMSGNEYTKVRLADGREYANVRFSINRNGSTFAVDANTDKLVKQYYVHTVENDVVIEETNVDPIETYAVKLNGETLKEGEDYTTTLSDKAGEWSKRTYIVSKKLFENEGEYTVVVESTDKAQSTAFSDVKKLNVSFVVDKTAPELTITGLADKGRYQVDEQTVTIIPTDNGGRLYSLKVIVLDSDGNPLKDDAKNDISVRFDKSGEEFLNYLNENGGKVTFTVPGGLENQVKIVCTDCATKNDGSTNEYEKTFKKVTVSQSGWIIFYANKPLFYGSIAGVLLLVGAIIFLIVYKKRKGEEKK